MTPKMCPVCKERFPATEMLIWRVTLVENSNNYDQRCLKETGRKRVERRKER